MKPETNNELDLLLRRLGRSAPDLPADGDHLDADELSSYAENALPAAARARYTEHLAECASCRKLVAQLSSSAGVVSAVETAKVSPPSALRNFLANLFSPMVLRYAVPALGLIVVAVIGFTVLRRNERSASVAKLNAPEHNATAVQPQQVESPAPGVVASRGYGASPATPEPRRGEQSKETQPAPSATDSSAGKVIAQANEAAPVAQAEAPPPASTPAASQPAASDETQKRAKSEESKPEIANRSVSALPVQGATTDSVKRREDRKSDNDFLTASPAAKTAGTGSIAKLQRDGADESADKEEKDKNAETRSVAGRRFRRERGVWVDTAYEAPRNTVNLTRGSEQYRALVADEPAIKTIAEQLDGEIIVVWKGRAYRIQ